MVQANARLGRLLELAERQHAAGGSAEVVPIDPLLDLLQAIDDSQGAGRRHPLASPLPWWRRLLGEPPAPARDPMRQGLEMARPETVEGLVQALQRMVDEADPRDHAGRHAAATVSQVHA